MRIQLFSPLLMSNNSIITSQKAEWLCIKIPFILFSVNQLISTLIPIGSISSGKGLCLLFDCSPLLSIVVKSLIIASLIVCSIFYLMEKQMIVSTFGIFAISLLVFSLHESFGVSARTGVFTLIWLAQFLAYLSYKNNQDEISLQKTRIFYPVQVIVACYTLAGLSKIWTSGSSWFYDARLMVLQLLKSNQMEYFDGKIPAEAILSSKIQFVFDHKEFMAILLMIALLIEVTSGIGLLNKKLTLLYGCLLLSLHVGIDLFFSVKIEAFYKSMIIFMINPLYLVYLLINKIPIFRSKTL